MKVLFVIFTICITYTLGEEILKAIGKSYPKKYRSYINGKILLNAAKHEKSSIPPLLRSYTVFQFVGPNPNMSLTGVPDSPYFPVDQAYDQKSRVKKALPLESPWSILRYKRSAVLNVSPVGKDDKKIEAKDDKKIEAKDDKKIEAKDDKKIEAKDDKKIEAKDDKKIEAKAAEVEKVTETTTMTTAAAEKTTVKKSSPPKEVQEESKSTIKIDTTKAKSATDIAIERAGSTATTKNPVRKGNSQPKSKAAQKKNTGRVSRNSKPKGKNAAAGKAKPKTVKRKQAKSAKKPKGNQMMRRKDNIRKGTTQRNKKQKAIPKKGRAGKISKETRRLTGAREALIEDYPYVVSIQKDEQHWCAGALLNERLVITTANCLWKANHISRMEVRAGSRNSNRGGQQAGIQEVMKHPNWGLRKNPDNDVALLLLDKSLRFSDSLHGVDLPNRVMLPAFDDAWITSWGTERRDGVYEDYESTSLQVYHARLIDRAKCNNVTMRFSVVVTENFICLAQTGRQAPCTRDTGAPAVSDGILWGLASWGIRKLCGTERFPAVFTYLASHSNMQFIINATHFLMSDKRQYPFGDRYPANLMKRK